MDPLEALRAMEQELRSVRRARELARMELEEMLGRTREVPAFALPFTLHGRARHTALASLAGTLRGRGLTTDEILACLLMVNDRRCLPPLTENELVRYAWAMVEAPGAAA